VVPHHSTDWSRYCLTAEIGRDPVLSILYGRSLLYLVLYYLYSFFTPIKEREMRAFILNLRYLAPQDLKKKFA
jgi:hypothetical protein